MTSIAFICINTTPFDGTTISKRGLGGTETAVYHLAKNLATLGFGVVVFNDCNVDDCSPGVYNDVVYAPLVDIKNFTVDIVVSVHSVIPFAPPKYYNQIPPQKFSAGLFDNIIKTAKYKVLSIHNTALPSPEDPLLEPLLLEGHIDKVFTQSDFQTVYITNCAHGPKRNFEVLKNKIWQTRGGVESYIFSVNIDAKDPNLFISSCSIFKGLQTLIYAIWPKIKARLPDAKLTVLGGYYITPSDFRDPNKDIWEQLVRFPGNKDVTFTGVISQQNVAERLAKASFLLAPSVYPETFGLSLLEAQAYNCTPITCRFGASEETATDATSYKIDYPVEPNNLYPNIDGKEQIAKYVELAVGAYLDRKTWRTKAENCNELRGIIEWNKVAKQWKQHFYNVLDEYLPVEEYREISEINNKVAHLFNRRFSNPKERTSLIPTLPEQEIVVISPFYNAEKYIRRCIESVAAQDYENYTHILINDCSTDNSEEVALDAQGKLHYRYIDLRNNKKNMGAVCNQITAIREQHPQAIIMLLDGDDCLVNDPNIFKFYNYLYSTEEIEFTYGSCWSMVDNIPLIAQEYPPEVKKKKAYRCHKFNWNMPYPHPRTFRKYLVETLSDDVFKDKDGKWYRAGGDNAVFYNILEQADPDKVRAIPDIHYNYNDTNPLNDYKVHHDLQNQTAKEILASGPNRIIEIIDDIHAGEAQIEAGKKAGVYPPPTIYPPLMVRTGLVPQYELDAAHKTIEKAKIVGTTLTQEIPMSPNKKILIAIPTAKNIETDCFKSIYDQIIPPGYETDFQCFYGNNISQVRNLIADWVIKGYDYLWAVDSDIAFPPDTLMKLLSHNVPMVSGMYIQRKPGEHNMELYDMWYQRVHYGDIANRGLVEIGGCGFGCVLIKKEVLVGMGYPQFHWVGDLAHKAMTEDVYFCCKAREHGFKIYADTSVKCRHLGPWEYTVQDIPAPRPFISMEDGLRDLSKVQAVPIKHHDYLCWIRDQMNVRPKVIYDIGACVLHWTNMAKFVWPDAQYVMFDAFSWSEFLFKENNFPYWLGVLGDKDNVEIEFYENPNNPGGNGIFKNNPQFIPNVDVLFDDKFKQKRIMRTLDSVVKEKGFPLPDLVKMDIQGSELAVLKGATYTLSQCKDLILELQKVELQLGAPQREDAIIYLNSIGFKLVKAEFCANEYDGDYHFQRA